MAAMRQVKDKMIIPPEEGWEEHTLYLVEVSYRPSNPVHTAYLEVGFLNGEDGGPGGYSYIWCNSYDGAIPFYKAHYLNVLQKLCCRK